MIGLILKTVVVLILCLVVADVGGVVICTVFDIMPIRSNSVALPYAIWFVIGVFCGLSAFSMAGAWHLPDSSGDWFSDPAALRTATLILATSTAVILGLGVFFYAIYWSRGVAGEYYVPDSASHSVTFFVAVLGVMVLFRQLLKPEPPGEPVNPRARKKRVP